MILVTLVFHEPTGPHNVTNVTHVGSIDISTDIYSNLVLDFKESKPHIDVRYPFNTIKLFNIREVPDRS